MTAATLDKKGDRGETATLDENDCPRVPHPPTNDGSLLSFAAKSAMAVFAHFVLTPLVPFLLIGWGIKNKLRIGDVARLYRTVDEADDDGCSNAATAFRKRCRDPALLSKLWKLPSAKRYLRNGDSLEYQLREGYCSLATLRCVLRSFRGCCRGRSSSLSSFLEAISAATPKQTDQSGGRPSDPAKWQKQIDEIVAEAAKQKRRGSRGGGEEETGPAAAAATETECCCRIRTDVVRGDASYEEFLRAIRKGLADGNDDGDDRDDADNNDSPSTERTTTSSSRVAVNFLRPALFGFKRPKWIPFNLVLSLFGGHFSPVIGILEDDDDDDGDNTTGAGDDNPLVGVFDVNHAYGGAYLVPARLLYKSVNAVDIATGTSRAVIVVTLVEEEEETMTSTATIKRKEE